MEYNQTQTLEFIHTDEGRIRYNGVDYAYDYYLKDHLGNTRVVFTESATTPNIAEVLQVDNYYPFGMRFNQAPILQVEENNYLYNGKELQENYGLDWYDYGFRFYDAALARWHVIDPMIEKHYEYTPYAYAYNNPVLYIDVLGLDTTVYVIDQDTRPNDNGTSGETYTADIYIYDDYTGELDGPYSGSSYPNSKSNTDNSTSANTVNEGDFPYDNSSGHSGSTEKGLNVVNDDGERKVPGTKPNGDDVTMTNVNVHEGASDNGNYNSRGSQGCVTINPSDSESFFSNFSWTGNGYTGNSKGTISIFRGNQTERANKVSSIKKAAAAQKKAHTKTQNWINYQDIKSRR